MTRRGYWCVTGLLALGCLMPKAKLLDKPDGGGGGVGGEAGADAGRTGEGGALGGQSTGGATGGAQGGASGSGVTGGAGGTAPSAGTGGGAATAGGTSGAGGSSTGGGSAGEAGFGGEGGNDGGAGVVGVGGASGFAGGAGAGLGGSGVSAGEEGQGGDEGAGGSGVGGAAGTAGASTGGTATGGAGTGGATPVGCGPEGPSCAGGLTCGVGNTSCCESLVVEGGSYERAPGETPSYPATVSSFCLDKYEVTVGRFRKFVGAYDAWRADGHPELYEGSHPQIGASSGWNTDWNTSLPEDATEFKDTSHLNTNSDYKTWRNVSASDAAERLPINYVSWYEAFAFCLWDGGRLPTEAEWQYAAQGGNRNWDYPWGDEAPTSTRAVYDHMGDGISGYSYADILPVGSKPDGNGYWQQSDLAGSMWEWNLDWYAAYSSTECKNCANLVAATYRVYRGGSWSYYAETLRASSRSYGTPSNRYGVGLRCARTPK